MPRFFITSNPKINEEHIIDGKDASHIAKSLRMEVGEDLTLCNPNFSTDFHTEILEVGAEEVKVLVLDKRKNDTERAVEMNLYQCIPKATKMEEIIEHGTEVGVNSFTPVLSRYCVSRPDEVSSRRKAKRYESKADSAAKQSGRGTIPKICDQLDFEEAVKQSAKKNAKTIIFYEKSDDTPTKADLEFEEEKSIGIFIGSEGGFTRGEVEFARQQGALVFSLGKRILRTETAPVVAMTMLGTILEDY